MLHSCQDNSTCCVLDPQLFSLFRASLQSSPFSYISKLFPPWIFLSIRNISRFPPAQERSFAQESKGASLLTLLKEYFTLTASSSSPFTHVNPCSLASAPTILRNYMPQSLLTMKSIVLILLNLSIVSDTMLSLSSGNSPLAAIELYTVLQ